MTAHMRKLVTHMNDGNNFESYYDVLDTIFQRLYAEADQRSEAHQDTRPTEAQSLAQASAYTLVTAL